MIDEKPPEAQNRLRQGYAGQEPRSKRIYVYWGVALALLLVAGLTCWLWQKGKSQARSPIVAGPHRQDSPNCGGEVEKVYRPPVAITAEEIRVAISGDRAQGHKLEIEPPGPWYLENHAHYLHIQVTVSNVSGGPLGFSGNWAPCGGRTLGLPPEHCFLEATHNGMPIKCDRRPPGTPGYGGLGNSAMGYPLNIQDYGDFSKPGKYTVRLIAKSPVWWPNRKEETALLASNAVQFVVPEKKQQR